MMMACLDVAYHALEANSAAVLFHSWDDGAAWREIVTRVPAPADYRPGQFYRRELPCLLALVALIGEPLEVLIVDGYVWLGEGDLPGLGAHLHAALGGAVAVTCQSCSLTPIPFPFFKLSSLTDYPICSLPIFILHMICLFEERSVLAYPTTVYTGHSLP